MTFSAFMATEGNLVMAPIKEDMVEGKSYTVSIILETVFWGTKLDGVLT